MEAFGDTVNVSPDDGGPTQGRAIKRTKNSLLRLANQFLPACIAPGLEVAPLIGVGNFE